MTQEQFGELFGIVKSTVSLYESGKSTPNDEIKKQICNYFDVSISYLMGYTDTEKHGFFFFFDEWQMYHSRILKKLEDLSISEAEFEDDTGIHLDAEAEVNVSSLITTANYLNVTTDYLLGLTDAEYVSSEDISLAQSLTDRERDVLAAFRRLDDDNKDIIVGEIKKCLKEQRHSSVAADEPFTKTGTTNTGN